MRSNGFSFSLFLSVVRRTIASRRVASSRVASHPVTSRQSRRLEPHAHARTTLPVRQGYVTRALPRQRSHMRPHVGSPRRAGGAEQSGGRHATPGQVRKDSIPIPSAPHQEGHQLPGVPRGRARGQTTVSFFVVCSCACRPYRRGTTQGLSPSLFFHMWPRTLVLWCVDHAPTLPNIYSTNASRLPR